MKRRLALVLAAGTAAISIAACSGGGGGGGDTPGGGYVDDGGEGTGTLKVVVSISVDDGFIESGNLSLTDQNSSAVAGASVVLTTPDSAITMVEQTPGLGVYSLPAGFDTTYGAGFQLDVTRGTDTATGITIAAPELTEVLTPANQSAIPVGAATTVTWAGQGADQFRVELLINDYDSGWQSGDPGTFEIGAANVNTAGTETLTVRRRKTMPITSGRPGSEFKIDLEDDVLLLVQ